MVLVAAVVAAPTAFADEIVVEVRVHGNHSIADEEILALAGVVVGQNLDDTTASLLEERLWASGRFDTVEVRKRYRSLTDDGQLVLVIVVHEKERWVDKLLFLPILQLTEEYGLTYGARVTGVGMLGGDERLSLPLSWGGIKRAALEFDLDLDQRALSRVQVAFSASRRENPHYQIDDDRLEVRGRAMRRVGRLRLELHGGWSKVSFEPLDERFVDYGVSLTLDTRRQAFLPREAVVAGFGWQGMKFLDRGHPINRYRFEVGAFKGVVGQAVLSLQAEYRVADRQLPLYEQAWLGGTSSLRGYRAGEFAGDNLARSSLELRVPIKSPLGGSRAAVGIFFDSGAVYNHDRALGEARFHHATGISVFLAAPFAALNLDLAHDLQRSWRLHLNSGIRF